jgi:SAM-dependent methyltransferase
MRTLERQVLGCDFGGTSWTTREQADTIPAALGLINGTRLLEIGAGTGWPGLHMASVANCEVTLLDIPFNALVNANQRAVEERLGNRVCSVAASGTALPFSDASFDAIAHSDVLCCLPGKLEMLQECRRVVNAGARMLFYVIAPARDLSADEFKEVCEVGPPFVDIPDDYTVLLDQSDWTVLEKTDLTVDYLQASRRMVDGLEADEMGFRTVMGDDDFIDYLEHRRSQIRAIERGLLEREVYITRAD